VDTAYTDAEISIGYEFSIESLYCTTKDIGYVFNFTVIGGENATNNLITIDTASK
jgi:hypothetical protein